MNPPVLVCSHKRSGTHLLAATIYKNFELPDMSIHATIRSGMKFIFGDQEWEQRATIPWGKLCSNHNFYNPAWYKEPQNIIYIVRHPIPTLTSLWRIMDPELKNDPDLYLGSDRIEYWQRHVKGFTQNCFWIRYEDLIDEKHDEILETISDKFNLTPKLSEFERVEESVGWYSIKEPVQDRIPPITFINRFSGLSTEELFGYDIDAY